MNDALQVGAERATDYRVAVEVMGWTPFFVDRAHPLGRRLPDGPLDALDYYDGPVGRMPCGWSPSTDIAAAWEVLAAVIRQRNTSQFHIGWADDGEGRVGWYVVLGYEVFASECDTAPLAICKAALAAVGATPTPTPAPTPEQYPSL